jgi:large subunit ribosomal protein L4
MATAPYYTSDGSDGPKVKLNKAVFDVEPNAGLVHQVAVCMMLNVRHGNHATKTRGEVRGGGKKPYAQKGTGNARHGSTREPQMRGGGTVWGPHPRSYRRGIPLGMKRKALCCVLTDRVRNDALCVIEGFGEATKPRTRPVAELVAKINPEGRKALIVAPEHDAALVASARNLPRVTVRTAADLNALDVLSARRVIVVKDALKRLEERLA